MQGMTAIGSAVNISQETLPPDQGLFLIIALVASVVILISVTMGAVFGLKQFLTALKKKKILKMISSVSGKDGKITILTSDKNGLPVFVKTIDSKQSIEYKFI